MNFKKVLSSIIAASLCISTFGIASAAEANTVEIKSYFNGEEITGNIFVGETVRTVLSVENLEETNGFDLGFMYDNSVIQVPCMVDEDELDNYYDFEDDSVGNEDIYDYVTVEEYMEDNYSKIRSYVLPNLGAFVMARNADGDTAVTDRKEAFSFEFEAIAPGTSGFRFLEYTQEDMSNIFAHANIFLGAEDVDGDNYYCNFHEALAVNPVANNFTVLEAPDSVENLDWAEGENLYKATWEEPATGCRGYEVLVFVNGTQIGSPVTVEDTEYDLSEEGILSSLKTGDMVVVKVKALGGSGSDYEATTEKEIEGTPLDTPVVTISKIDNKNYATWEQINNASGYTVEIYDGETLVKTETITDPATENYDLSTVPVGEYTVKVTANASGPLYIPATGEVAYSTGSTITGYIKLEAAGKTPVQKTTTVSLKDALGNVYSDDCDSNGYFEIKGVPGDAENGIEYQVKVERQGAVTRTLFGSYIFGSTTNETLVLKNSVEKCISKGDGIAIYLGDFRDPTVLSIDSNDVSAVADNLGTNNTDYDLVEEDDASADAVYINDLRVVIANYGKGLMHYGQLNDYDFTISE